MSNFNKKILLFNAKREKCEGSSPHLGLAMLASVLKESEHVVLVVDYQFNPTAPTPDIIVEKFKPDIIGITLYTATMKEANKIIDIIVENKIPLLVGGPHATLYPEDLVDIADYVIVGEAENCIENLVNNAKLQTKGKIIRCQAPDPKKLPYPDFSAFMGFNNIYAYPLLTSRGCPYNCSFCAVRFVSTREWRPRLPEECIKELLIARKQLINIESVIIYDDNPMFRKVNMKNFLKLYLENEINLPLNVINTRADSLDNEMITLLKKAKCPSIGIGVESGHSDVFDKIGKGESLEDIEIASKLIKSHNIPLALCFVIGLEDDTYEKIQSSIDFAKHIKPDQIYWNMITPFKGTKIREWYDENGIVFDLINRSSYVDGDFMCEEPCAETPEFSIEERKKAYILAILKTNDTRLKLRDIPHLYPYVKEYCFFKEFIYWIPNNIGQKIRKPYKMLKLAMNIYPEVGINGLLKRLYRKL